MPRFKVSFTAKITTTYRGVIEYEATTAEEAQDLADEDHDNILTDAYQHGKNQLTELKGQVKNDYI